MLTFTPRDLQFMFNNCLKVHILLKSKYGKVKIKMLKYIVVRTDILSQQLAGHIPNITSIRTKLSDPFPT